MPNVVDGGCKLVGDMFIWRLNATPGEGRNRRGVRNIRCGRRSRPQPKDSSGYSEGGFTRGEPGYHERRPAFVVDHSVRRRVRNSRGLNRSGARRWSIPAPGNSVIVDIDNAPRNAAGLIVYSFDIQILT